MRRVGSDCLPVYRLAAISSFLLWWSAALPAAGQPPPGGSWPPDLQPAGPAALPHSPPSPEAAPRQPPGTPAQGPALVAGVRIVGNRSTASDKVRSYLRTRVDRPFDPETVQQDVRELVKSGLFRDVRTYTEQTPRGVVVTFEVFELPTIGYVKFLGNRRISDRVLRKQVGLEEGEPLSTYQVNEAQEKLQRFYRSRGYTKSQVAVFEGNRPDDRGVVFVISEGSVQRIWSVKFEGNTIASDRRLRTQIQSKPGLLKFFFKGKVDRRKIEEDVQRLTAYYRALGYFNAKVGRELRFGASGKWLTLVFVIREGPRYHLRNVSVLGNRQLDTAALLERLELKSGDPFNASKMQRDLRTLVDAYGSQGYVFADIKADPRFLEEPGWLDLTYNIKEGQQYRVGHINIHIAGEYPHTKLNVVRNRISLRPGDIIDVRKLRESERRLKASQLFVNEPARGVTPRITVVPPDLKKAPGSLAGNGRPGAHTCHYRGQSPNADAPGLDRNVDTLPNHARPSRPLTRDH